MKKLLALFAILFSGGSASLVFLAASTFVSEDLACIGAGILIARGEIGLIPGILACFLGIFLGDIWLFLMGRWLGRPALSRWPFRRWVREKEVEQATKAFQKRGPSLVFASRFLPGSRLPVYFAAGLLGTNFWKFTGYFAIACLIWTPLLVGSAVLLQQRLLPAFQVFSQSTFLLFAVAGLFYFLIRILRSFGTYKRRRLLLSVWRRWTRWEFWPLWLFYPPVVLYVFWLAIKHRSLTLFALANPAMPGGGFAGESKSEILRALAGAGDFVAKHVTVERPQGAIEARKLMTEKGWNYPVVLKPDQGERGYGVAIVRSDEELRAFFVSATSRVILQEYVPGFEFGVFYIRHPDKKDGSIYAITDKKFLSVRGDGQKTLENLILADDRAVCMAELHLRNHLDHLNRVVPEGELVQLVELGTHCRGSLFLEGIHFKTPELEKRIDEISKSYKGFFFGRYDIRTPSVEDFVAGRNFKIVELNGVTSEATSIYDPSHSLLHAYRVLGKQWRIAFEIGAGNRKLGYRPPGVKALLRMLGERRKESPAAATNQRNEYPEGKHHVLDTQTARI